MISSFEETVNLVFFFFQTSSGHCCWGSIWPCGLGVVSALPLLVLSSPFPFPPCCSTFCTFSLWMLSWSLSIARFLFFHGFLRSLSFFSLRLGFFLFWSARSGGIC